MPPKKAGKGKAAKAPALPALPQPLPVSLNYLRSHEHLVEEGAGLQKGQYICNNLRAAAGHLLAKEHLTFEEQVEAWPYIFWPPLPQWYTLPFKRKQPKEMGVNMAREHNMNTTDRLERHAVTGLFSDPPPFDLGGNLFYTNMIIPIFHEYMAEGKDPVKVWSLIHYTRGANLKQAENGEYERDLTDMTQEVTWHVPARWHFRGFFNDTKAYIQTLTHGKTLNNDIDQLKNQVLFPAATEITFYACLKTSEGGFGRRSNVDADPAQYSHDSFLFCVLTVARLALMMHLDPEDGSDGLDDFGLKPFTVRRQAPPAAPGAEAGDDNDPENRSQTLDVSDSERAAAILLLGIRDLFEHESKRLHVPNPADPNGYDNFDLDTLIEDGNNKWAKASAEWARDLIGNLRASVKLSFGGPYDSADAHEGGDGDGGDDGGGDGGDDKRKHSRKLTPKEKDDNNEVGDSSSSDEPESPNNESKGKNPSKSSKEGKSSNGGKSTEAEPKKSSQVDPDPQGRAEETGAKTSGTATKHQEGQEVTKSSLKTTDSSVKGKPLQEKLPQSKDTTISALPPSQAASGASAVLRGHTESRKRRKNSLFSESSDEEKGEKEETGEFPAVRRFKTSSIPHQADIATTSQEDEDEDEAWEGFDDEVEVALKSNLTKKVEEKSTTGLENTEDESMDEEEEDEEESESESESSEEETKDVKDMDIGGDGSFDNEENEARKYRYMLYHKLDKNVDYLPEYGMLYTSI